MHVSSILPLLPLTAASLLPQAPQHIFSNPHCADKQAALNIPTSYESAVLARRILHLTPLGTLSTVFQSQHSSSLNEDDRQSGNSRPTAPAGIAGSPVGLLDYIADCEDAGNPTILAINIATSFRNVAAGSNISLSLAWTPPHPPSSRMGFSSESAPLPYSAANLPRFSLIGYLESIPEKETSSLAGCFTKVHPDAKYWLPGNPIHSAEWVRLVVQGIYWVGGFGDRAYIGWIPVEEWQKVTRKEWEDVRLPGEKKGWKEWAVEMVGGLEL